MNLLKSASTVSAMTLLSRVTGLVRESLVAATFGVSALTDAFNVAFRIPNLLRRLFAEGAFSQAFVPVLAAERAKNEAAAGSVVPDPATQTLIDHIATALMGVLLLTCLVGVVGAPVLVWAMASGLPQDAQAAAVAMTRIMFPYIAFMSMVAFAAGILNTYKRFAVPAFAPVLLNVAFIAACYFLAPAFGRWGWPPIYALAVGVMGGGVLQLASVWWALRRIGRAPRVGFASFRWAQFRVAWQHEGTRRVLRLMLPALLGVSVAHISLLINTQIASHLAPGSVTWLAGADRLMEFPAALLGVALGVVITPALAAAKAQSDPTRYAALLDWALRWVLLLALPCAVALLLFAQPLIAVMYHYGAFQWGDVQQTSVALAAYGVGLLGLIAIKVLAPGYYASQNVKTPVKIAVFVLFATQVLNAVFVPHFAHAGLALAISCGAWLNAGLLWWGLRRSGQYRARPGWLRLVLQVCVATALLALYLAWAANALHWSAGAAAGQSAVSGATATSSQSFITVVSSAVAHVWPAAGQWVAGVSDVLGVSDISATIADGFQSLFGRGLLPRMAQFLVVVAGAALVYGAALMACGFKPRAFLRTGF